MRLSPHPLSLNDKEIKKVIKHKSFFLSNLCLIAKDLFDTDVRYFISNSYKSVLNAILIAKKRIEFQQIFFSNE